MLQVFASFDMSIQTVDVDVNGDHQITGADLNDAQLLAIDLSFLQLNPTDSYYSALAPAGASGVLPGFFVGAGGVGFQVNSGHLTFATIKANPDPAKSVDVTRTYTAILASIRGASLVGLPDSIQIEAISLDFVSSGSSLSTPTVPVGLDWAHAIDLQSTATTFGADAVVIGGRTIGLTAADAGLSIGGRSSSTSRASCWPPANSSSSSSAA